MNVDEVDQFPFLATEVNWIRVALVQGVPILGVCLGSQLLAKAAGAKVYANGVKEIGWYELGLTPAAANDPLFAGVGPQATVFQWHGDTFDLPDGAVHLASSPPLPPPGFPRGRLRLGAAIPRRDDAGTGRELAGSSRGPSRAGRAALHRSRREFAPNFTRAWQRCGSWAIAFCRPLRSSAPGRSSTIRPEGPRHKSPGQRPGRAGALSRLSPRHEDPQP